MFSTDDTIVAVATPQGRGGIGVVRVSGPDAARVAQTLAGRQRPFQPRRATLVQIRDQDAGALIDRAVVTWFAAPRSYTGEDVVEISGHGSPVLMAQILSLAIRAGARLAEPGEFTFRAYLNGRLDLVQAEAVADLVAAVTPLQARAAMDQLDGTLTARIAAIDGRLFDLVARLEASLDFPDEGFHFAARDETRSTLDALGRDLDALASEGRAGRVLREGRLVAIVGPPNVGKSSLFNALLGADRAIVTNVPGTTRDLLTERMDLDGLPVTLVDTAGLREAADAIEAEGVARARQTQGVAALTLVVLDRSVAPGAGSLDWLTGSSAQRLVVLNKSDRPSAWPAPVGVGDERCDVSAHTGAGLPDLKHRIATMLTGQSAFRDPPAISNVRHLAQVDAARVALERATAALEAGSTEEVVLAEAAAAREALELIAGRRAPDAVLRRIFEQFCIGK